MMFCVFSEGTRVHDWSRVLRRRTELFWIRTRGKLQRLPRTANMEDENPSTPVTDGEHWSDDTERSTESGPAYAGYELLLGEDEDEAGEQDGEAEQEGPEQPGAALETIEATITTANSGGWAGQEKGQEEVGIRRNYGKRTAFSCSDVYKLVSAGGAARLNETKFAPKLR